jgi:hypothetical protein
VDRRALLERLQYHAQAGEAGLRVLGWYHSHTRSALAFSTDDLSIHYKFFKEPWQVGLLLRPNAGGGARGGFFFREPGGAAIRTSASYLEFSIEADPSPELKETIERNHVPQRRPSPAAQPPAVAPVESHSFTSLGGYRATPPRPHRAGRRTVWAVLASMLVVAAAAVAYLRFYHSPSTAAAPAFLRVEALHKSGNVEVRWDTNALAGVQRALLDIQDGPLRAQLILDERTLASGSVSYAATSEVTGFHLRAERNDGTALEGSTTYIAPDAPSSAAASAAPPEPEPAKPEPPKPEPPKPEPPKPEPAKTQTATVNSAERTKPVEVAAAKPPAAPPRRFTAVPSTTRTTATGAPVTLAEPPPSIAPSQPGSNPVLLAQQTIAPPQQPVTAPKPAPAAPPKPSIQLAGRWVLQPGTASRSPGTPEAVAINIIDNGGAIQGSVDARYRGVPRQSFSFSGRMAGGSARFPWTSSDGKRGQIEFIRVPNIPDMIEVVWYGPDSKQVFDHIVRKVN